MGSPATYLGRVRITPYDATRVALGVLLLVAAALKGYQLATRPMAETSLLTSRWFLIGVVEFELFFGLWLLSGLCPRRTWQVAVLCFIGFGCISLYKAISGEASCGCFGKVPVNPWYTLVLDLAAVAALLRWRPATTRTSSPLPQAGEGAGVRAGPRRHFARVLGVWLFMGIPAAVVMGSYQAATLDEAGDIFGDSEFVVLEPEKWVGRRFPLLDYIDIGDRLAEGEWIAVLYHHDCRTCQRVVPRYQELARAPTASLNGAGIALIQLPPYGGPGEPFVSRDSPCVLGRVKDVKEWFVDVPVRVDLSQGTVTGVVGKNVQWDGLPPSMEMTTTRGAGG